MIIVEGPDGAGKTTLINQLVVATGLEVAPRVVSKDTEALTDLVRWTEDNVKRGFQATIFDRHRLFSEPIYGPVLRSSLTPEFADPEWFSSWLSALYDCDPIIIYCLPPLDVVWENVLEGDDNKFFHGNLPAVQAIWGAYLNKALTETAFRANTYIYDYTDPCGRHLILRSILHTIKERTQHV